MPLCYFVPGVLSSELGIAGPPDVPLFVSYSQIALGRFGVLRLAPDGVSPGEPDGRQMVAGAPLHEYYDVAIESLQTQLTPHSYTVVPVGYDWRLAVRSTGTILADRIRREVTAAVPCAIIGHSMGGLVARAAWTDLLATGEQALVRRIVTLCTPHQGSYASVRALLADEEGVDQALAANALIFGLTTSTMGIIDATLWDRPTIAALIATWPSMYDLLPCLGSEDSVDDQQRALLYDSVLWQVGFRPPQAQLDRARLVTQPWLLDPASLPPPYVLTTIAGRGLDTPARLVAYQSIVDPGAITRLPVGDGRVTERSALVTGSVQLSALMGHWDAAPQQTAVGAVAAAVLDDRGPATPIPPVSISTAPYRPDLTGPPFAGHLGRPANGAICAPGRCAC